MKRREFIKLGAKAACGLCLVGCQDLQSTTGSKEKRFKISLAQWSLHRRLRGQQGPKLDNLDFAKTARGFGIGAVEYVNLFFMDKVGDTKYLSELNKRAADYGVKSLLIMCDREGNLGEPDSKKRIEAVQNHYKWVEAAKFLGCHSIRVNARSKGSADEQLKLATDGLSRLSAYAAGYNISVIVENHGGLSSNGLWLAGVIKKVGMPNCGTLPDFGNFGDYDRYKGVAELMPFAKGVSAKSDDFDEDGNEIYTDYYRMMDIVLKSGYNGYVGIEYEGDILSEDEGTMATKRLLEKVREKFASHG